MKKGIALLTVVGMLAAMAVPASAEEQITTYKGGQEIVLTEAGDVDITIEELAEKAENAMNDAEDIALYMKMDVDATMSYKMEDTEMSMDMVIKADMLDNKNGDLEYKSENMSMSFFGMDMNQVSEEYIFPNADGVMVSVKKETSSDVEDEDAESWVAEIAEEDDGEEIEEGMEELGEEIGETTSVDSVVSDELFESFELLDKMYTDGEKNYYVLKANTSDVMNNGGFGDVGEMFGDVNSDSECYMLFSEDGMLESLYMDLGSIEGMIDEESGTETSFSAFVVELYTEEAAEIEIPQEVQAAGDAAA